MIDIRAWTDAFSDALHQTFGDRVWFIGLQGSYARGEATDMSDIDPVVILDKLSASDIQAYRAMLDTLPHRELICGFLGGKSELLHWEPADLFQLYHDTHPIEGSLDLLIPLLGEGATDRAIRNGACNIYHGCVHNMLFDKSEEILRGLYKSAAFVLQAVHFQRTGVFVHSQKELCPLLDASDRVILDASITLRGGGTVDFDQMSAQLFLWAKDHIEKEEWLHMPCV